jgi:hypothetical protein
MLPRLWSLVMEKMRDNYRLSIGFESGEPRLDDAKIISDLIARVEADTDLSKNINYAANCLIASLFYFELDSMPEWSEGKFILAGHIYCCIRQTDPAFNDLMERLQEKGVKFVVSDGQDTIFTSELTSSRKDIDFAIRVYTRIPNSFTVSMKIEDGHSYNISGSPFSVTRLVQIQVLDAHFGQANHRKRKRSRLEIASHCQKRRCT